MQSESHEMFWVSRVPSGALPTKYGTSQDADWAVPNNSQTVVVGYNLIPRQATVSGGGQEPAA